MAIDSQKLVNLLARDIPQVHIAKALGLTEGRIAQLAEDEKVKAVVVARRAELATEELNSISSIEDINKALLLKMKDLAEESESLNECVNAYRTLTTMVDSKKGLGTNAEDGIRNITIQMPVFVQQNLNLTTNNRGEIVDIDQRSMATMPTLSVHDMIKERAKEKDSTTDIDPATVAL